MFHQEIRGMQKAKRIMQQREEKGPEQWHITHKDQSMSFQDVIIKTSM